MNLLRDIGRSVLESLVRHPGYKVLSLSVALLAWLYVQGGQVVEAKVRARLSWELPDEVMPIEPPRASVTLTVAGPRHATRKAAQSDVVIPIDLTDATVGEHSLDFASFPVRGLPPAVEVDGISPPGTRLMLDEVTEKKVRIEGRYVGDPAEGYRVQSVDVDPQVVTIRGPRATLDKMGDAATMPMDVSGFARDRTAQVQLDLPRSVVRVGEEPVQVAVDVEPTVLSRTFEDSPVQVWRQSGWMPAPGVVQVVLEGPSAEVRDIDPEDVVVFAHLPEDPDRATYEVPFGPTEGVRLRVLHGGGDEVRVISVEPPVVEVER